jgi:hypothetical protein
MAALDAHLLEREDDLREAARLLDAAKDGGGSALLIAGPAGIGKSARYGVGGWQRLAHLSD